MRAAALLENRSERRVGARAHVDERAEDVERDERGAELRCGGHPPSQSGASIGRAEMITGGREDRQGRQRIQSEEVEMLSVQQTTEPVAV